MNIHKNAKLTPLGRERRVKMMLDGHTPTRAAALAGVSPGTARKWLVRSPAGMQVVERRREQAAERRAGSAGSRSLSRDRPARFSTRLTVAGDTPTVWAIDLPVSR